LRLLAHWHVVWKDDALLLDLLLLITQRLVVAVFLLIHLDFDEAMHIVITFVIPNTL